MYSRALRTHAYWPARQAAGLQQVLLASEHARKASSTVPANRSGIALPVAAAVAAGGGAAPAAPLPGQQLELECADLAFGGKGVCRLPSGFVVFVDRALPGERLTARVVQSKRKFAKAVKIDMLRQHDAATEPVCQHFGPCGGCSLQSLQYEAQLVAKQRQVADLLRRTAGVADVEAILRPMVACLPGHQYNYRNKMEFTFSSEAWLGDGGGGPAAAVGSSGLDRCGSGARAGTGSWSRQKAEAAGLGGGGRGSSRGGTPEQEQHEGGLVLGLKLPRSSTAVLPIYHCHLQSAAGNHLLHRVVQLCRQHGLEAYNPASRTGLLQHVAIRQGTAQHSNGGSSSTAGSSSSAGGGGECSEEYLINIVTAADGRKALTPLARALMRGVQPQLLLQQYQQQQGKQQAGAPPPAAVVVGVVNSVSERGRPVGERRLAAEHVLAGRGFLTDRLGGLEFEVSANSFFQTNSRQAEVLYQLVGQAAALRPADVLLDLYCGTGSIGLSLAATCRQVHGVELNAAAVRDALRNAARNGITNASFIQGDLHTLRLGGWLPRPDVVVVDPTRPGLSTPVIDYLQSCGARRVVYVSCNASTQARDLGLLCGGGGNGDQKGPYRLVSVQAVDLYPQTWHVETVAVLDAVGAS